MAWLTPKTPLRRRQAATRESTALSRPAGAEILPARRISPAPKSSQVTASLRLGQLCLTLTQPSVDNGERKIARRKWALARAVKGVDDARGGPVLCDAGPADS